MQSLKPSPLSLAAPQARGFARAVAEPYCQCPASENYPQQKGRLRHSARRQEITHKALELGPDGLSRNEKRELLADPACIAWLHSMVWQLSDPARARKWGLADS